MRKDINMCIAVGGKYANTAVLTNQAVSYRETLLFRGDVAESIACGGVD